MSTDYNTTFSAFIQRNNDADAVDDWSDDGLGDIEDLIRLPDPTNVSTSQRRLKFYQASLPIENGVYEGLVDDQRRRIGLGIFSVKNGEDYYCGQWDDDKQNGFGYHRISQGASFFYGMFRQGLLSEGYGRQSLENSFEYEGKMHEGNFHGLGSLSIRIDGVNRNEPLLLVAQWQAGKAERVFINEIDSTFHHQFDKFKQSLSIAFSNDFNKQRSYFHTLIELLERQHLSKDLLKEINSNKLLPDEIKASADLLIRIDVTYENIAIFLNDDKSTRPRRPNYTECVRNACFEGLERYGRFLQSHIYQDQSETQFLKLDEIIGCSVRDIIEQGLNNIKTLRKNSSNSRFEQKILYVDPSVLELLKKLTRIVNEIMYEMLQCFHAEILNKEKKFINDLWLDYFNLNLVEYSKMPLDEYQKRLEEASGEFALKSSFFTSAYRCRLESNPSYKKYKRILKY